MTSAWRAAKRAVIAVAMLASFASVPAVHAQPRSLQAMVDAAPAGSVIDVPAGLYRESLTIDKPLTLDGHGEAEIRGSDVWSEWTAEAGHWRSSQTVPNFQTHGQCKPADGRCLHAEQAFLDGNRLHLDLSGTPSPGEFAVDAQRHVILGDNPEGHTVEVTTRQAWIVARSDDVTVENFTMKHAANDAQAGALSSGDRSNWTMQDNVLSDAHGAVASLGTGNHVRLIHNDISHGGELGVAGGNGSFDVIQSNTIHDNNIDGFDNAWEGGGVKAARTADSVWDDNDVFNNIGPGLWCDVDCRNLTISNNRTHDNIDGAGILFEVSDGARIFGNTAWNNGAGMGWGWGAGIAVSTSANTEVFNNVVAWNQSGISIIAQKRSDAPPAGVVNTYVHDNRIFQDTRPESLSLSWLQDWDSGIFAPGANNRGSGNTFWYPTPENGYTRFGWNGPVSHLSDFSRSPAGAGSYISDDQEAQVLEARGIDAEPQSVISARAANP